MKKEPNQSEIILYKTEDGSVKIDGCDLATLCQSYETLIGSMPKSRHATAQIVVSAANHGVRAFSEGSTCSVGHTHSISRTLANYSWLNK